MIADAKYGNATLNTKSKPKQMSKEWIKDHIEKEFNKDKADEILGLSKKNYTSVLVEIPPPSKNSKVKFSELKVDAKKKKNYDILKKLEGNS